ncbi:MAG TPA: condensation domain-containing protein [Acidobacteriota bacterium]|jgi:acyl carrier protein
MKLWKIFMLAILTLVLADNDPLMFMGWEGMGLCGCLLLGLLDSKGQSKLELHAEAAFPAPTWFFQQQWWVQEPWESDSAAHNYPLPLRIQGPLNLKALEASLQEIVRRHQVLRSVFRNVDGKLVQIIIPAEPIEIAVMDLTRMPEAERNAQASRLVLEEASRPFDLRRGPLLRVGLLRLGAEDHVLQLTTHDIVYDDWSTAILIRELSTLYPAFDTGFRSPLSEPSFQYGDFVRWQQERLRGRELESRLHFWKQQLSDKNDFHHLTTDQARPARRSYRGAREVMTFSDDTANFLKVMSQRERVSPFMMLLAAFQCLLHLYSSHQTIGVASCAANRSLIEVEGLIGRFGNQFILFADMSGNPTFRELLAQIRENTLTAYSYHDLPFGKLVEELVPVPDPSRNPLFQVMFVLQNAPKVEWQIPELNIGWFPVETRNAQFDLTVRLKIEPTLEVAMEYSTDLFEPATMRRLLEHYRTILQAMLKDPTRRIRNIEVDPKPPPMEIQRTTRVEISTPRDDLESKLVDIWEAALRIRPIGIDQNLFELGGDSLLAAQLFAQIEKAFGVKIPVAMLFKVQTIKDLAKIIRDH